MNFQTLKDYFQEFIECNQHKIMFLNGKDDIFEEFKVIDAINFLEEKDKEIERLNNIIEEQYKELELEKKSRQLLTDDLVNVCKISLKKDNIIKEVRNQLDYLETYSSKEDVFEDMKRRLDRIDKIIGSDKE